MMIQNTFQNLRDGSNEKNLWLGILLTGAKLILLSQRYASHVLVRVVNPTFQRFPNLGTHQLDESQNYQGKLPISF